MLFLTAGPTQAGPESSSWPGICPSLVWRRKTLMAGPGYGWMTKTTAGSRMPPIPLQLTRLQVEFIWIWLKEKLFEPKFTANEPTPSLLSPSLWFISPWERAKRSWILSLRPPPTHSLDHPHPQRELGYTKCGIYYSRWDRRVFDALNFLIIFFLGVYGYIAVFFWNLKFSVKLCLQVIWQH